MVLSIKQNRLPAKFQFPARLANDNLIHPWESCGASRGQGRRRRCQRREAQWKRAVKGSCVRFVSKTRANIFRWSDQMCVNVSCFVRPRNTADTYLRRILCQWLGASTSASRAPRTHKAVRYSVLPNRSCLICICMLRGHLIGGEVGIEKGWKAEGERHRERSRALYKERLKGGMNEQTSE